MNNDFDWNLRKVVDSIKMGTLDCRVDLFYFPHENIWETKNWQFTTEMADEIYDNLDLASQHLFLSVCLASHLLNRNKSPKYFPEWFQTKSTIKGLLGLDLSFDEMDSCLWGRAAIPGVDLVKGWNDQVLFAMVGSFRRDNKNNILTPDWTTNCMDAEARGSVQNAADLLGGKFPDTGFIFWPLLNPLEPSTSINGPSLGLPVYLSFLSVASNKLPLPAILATGELAATGDLHEVGGLKQKFGLAYEKGFTSFIYPLLPRVKAVETKDQVLAQGVSTLEEAKNTWFGDILPDNSKLLKLLMPIPLEYDINRLTTKFVGREWVMEDVDKWLADPDGSKIFWITGVPGVGKSALAAKIVSVNSQVIAAHFCDSMSEEKRNPVKMIRSLAHQLANNLPQYAECLEKLPVEQYLQEYSEAYTLFDKLIIEPLGKDFPPQSDRKVILIDALDEASRDSRNDIASILARSANKLPDWLRLLVTSRPELEVTTTLRSAFRYELSSKPELVHDDITRFLKLTLPQITPDQIKIMAERSEGNFLYLQHICDEIRSNRMSLEKPDEFPTGMNSIYLSFFDRQFGNDINRYRNEVRELLCLVVAANEPLDTELLRKVMGLKSKMELNDRLDLLGSLFPRKAVQPAGNSVETILPFHLSIIDWLTNRDCAGRYYVDQEHGHALLAEFGWEQYKNSAENMHTYFLACLPTHLAQAGRKPEAVELLKNFDLMVLRVKVGLLDQMLSDYRSIEPHLLEDEAVFFKDNAHILRKADSCWPADKILLQLAIEHPDESPITKSAEAYIMAGKVNWLWLKRSDRAIAPEASSLLQSFAGHTDTILGAIHLDSSRVLSWSKDNTVRVWSRETGKELHSTTINDIGQVHKINDHLCICLAPQCAVILDFTVLTEHIASAALQLSDESIVACDRAHLYSVNNAKTEMIALEQSESTRCIIECSKELILIIGIQGSIIAFNQSSKRFISRCRCIYDICNVRQLDKDQLLLNCTDRKIVWNYSRNQTIEITGTPLPGNYEIDELITSWLLLSGSPECKYLINTNSKEIVCIYNNWKLSDDGSLVIFVDNDKLKVLHTDSFNEVIAYNRCDYENRYRETIPLYSYDFGVLSSLFGIDFGNEYLINTNNSTFIALPKIWNISYDNRYLALVKDAELIVYEMPGMKKVFSINQSGIKSIHFSTDYIVINQSDEKVFAYALSTWNMYLCFDFDADDDYHEVKCSPKDLGFDSDDSEYYYDELHYITEKQTTYIRNLVCGGNTIYFNRRNVWKKFDLSSAVNASKPKNNRVSISFDDDNEDLVSAPVFLNDTTKKALSEFSQYINCLPNNKGTDSSCTDTQQNYCLYKSRSYYKSKNANKSLNKDDLRLKKMSQRSSANTRKKYGCGQHEVPLSTIGCSSYAFTQSVDNLLRLRKDLSNEHSQVKHTKAKNITGLSGSQVLDVLKSESFYVTTSINGLIKVFNKATLQLEKTFIFRKDPNKDISKRAREIHYTRTILGAVILLGDRLAVWNDEIVRIYDLKENVYNSGSFCDKSSGTVSFTVTVKSDDFSKYDDLEDYKLKQYEYYVHIAEGSIKHGSEGKYFYDYLSDSGRFRYTAGKHGRDFILDKQIDYITIDKEEQMAADSEFVDYEDWDDNNDNDWEDEDMGDEGVELNKTVEKINNFVEIRINSELGRWYAHTDTLLFDKSQLIDIAPSGRLVVKVPSGKKILYSESGYIKPVFSVLVLDIMKGFDQCFFQENECANIAVNIPTPEELKRNQFAFNESVIGAAKTGRDKDPISIKDLRGYDDGF